MQNDHINVLLSQAGMSAVAVALAQHSAAIGFIAVEFSEPRDPRGVKRAGRGSLRVFGSELLVLIPGSDSWYSSTTSQNWYSSTNSSGNQPSVDDFKGHRFGQLTPFSRWPRHTPWAPWLRVAPSKPGADGIRGTCHSA